MNIELTKYQAELLLEALERYQDNGGSYDRNTRSDELIELTKQVSNEFDAAFPII